MVKVELMHFAEPWDEIKAEFPGTVPVALWTSEPNIMIMKEKVIRAPSDLKRSENSCSRRHSRQSCRGFRSDSSSNANQPSLQFSTNWSD